MQEYAKKLDKYIFSMLLFTVAVIPLRQEFTAWCVAVTFLAAFFVRIVRGKAQPRPVLRTWQQGALYLMLGISAASILLSADRFLSFWNYMYVVGQYAALGYVLLQYGWQERDAHDAEEIDGSQPDGSTAQGAAAASVMGQGLHAYWQRFAALPRPVQLVGAFLGVSVLVSSIGIAQKFLGVTAEGIWVDPAQFPELKVRVFSTLVNPNILAGYLVLVLAYALAFFNVSKGRRRLRLLLAGVGFLAALCLLYTYSRGNWLACAVMLLAFCVLFCLKAIVPVACGGALALAVGGQAVLHRLASIGGREDTSTALRLAYLKSTKWIVEEFPLGVGWYGYRFVYPTYNFYLADKSVIMYHCHNIFLNVLAELGWHGLLAFLVIWFGIFLPAAWRLAYQGRSSWLQGMGRGYVLATVGIAVGGLTDHVYFNTQMGLFFWLFGLLTMIATKVNCAEE